ncbi:hypothetical protein T01_6637 [Trichinella spiralis]|uniref:Uncharacterized protein n=1 Tax=Trichinella spiralis TaxID=6334 RepID=A0A0V1B0L1_TRISP|nr:hypothetical protein T01_6637 [Trichinella spiralis]
MKQKLNTISKQLMPTNGKQQRLIAIQKWKEEIKPILKNEYTYIKKKFEMKSSDPRSAIVKNLLTTADDNLDKHTADESGIVRSRESAILLTKIGHQAAERPFQ